MKKTYLILILITTVFISCEDVDIPNYDDPDLATTLYNPNDYPVVLGGAYYAWWDALHKSSPYMTLSVAADHGSSSWGNFNMQNVGTVTEPYGLGTHIPLNNTQTAPYRNYLENPWYGLYSAISTANDILRGIRISENTVMNGSTDITDDTIAQALFIRGLGYGYLGLLFDQGFIVDENFTYEELKQLKTKDLVPHSNLINQSISDLEEAIGIIEGLSKFSITQFNGLILDKSPSLQLANTFIAKILANSARTELESSAIDWNKVKIAAEKGIEFDFAPIGDGGTNWWHAFRNHSDSGWIRVDQKIVNMANPTANPFPFPKDSYDIPTTFEDQRFGDENSNKWFTVSGSPVFRPDRGIYFFSYFKFNKYEEYKNDQSKPMVSVTSEDNDLLLAEAIIRTEGDLFQAATLINKTRVFNGGLAPATSGDADLLDKLFYERYLEAYETPGNPFFDRRRTGTLGNKQFTQFPIPARELNTLEAPLYTFGG